MSAGVAIVTGAGTGLGHEITRRLLDAGYSVALAGRTLATLERSAAGDAAAWAHVADVASAP